MSRFLTTTTVTALLLGVSGCYQPMYQPYGYGQPMYGPGYAQPGTMVVPPGNAPLYQPGAPGTTNQGTFENGNDDFKRESTDGKFFQGDPVPDPKDPSATDNGTQKFNSDFGN